MTVEGAETAGHWIVAILAAAIVIGGILMFGGRPQEPASAPATELPAQSN